MKPTPRLAAAIALVLGIFTLLPSGSLAQPTYNLRFLGFSPTIPPSDSLPFRQALAYAIDREAVVKAVTPYAAQPPQPAVGIQHPGLSGHNPSVRGYRYDPVKAKELYGQSGWTGPVIILVGPRPSRFVRALNDAVAESIRNTFGVTVRVHEVANFDALVRETRAGAAPVYMMGWRSDPRDFGYPSFALGLAHDRFLNPETKALAEKRDAVAVEQMLLDQALIVPIIFY